MIYEFMLDDMITMGKARVHIVGTCHWVRVKHKRYLAVQNPNPPRWRLPVQNHDTHDWPCAWLSTEQYNACSMHGVRFALPHSEDLVNLASSCRTLSHEVRETLSLRNVLTIWANKDYAIVHTDYFQNEVKEWIRRYPGGGMLRTVQVQLSNNLTRSKALNLARLLQTHFPKLRKLYLSANLLWVPSVLDTLTGIATISKLLPGHVEIVLRCNEGHEEIYPLDDLEAGHRRIGPLMARLQQYLGVARALRRAEEVRWAKTSQKVSQRRIGRQDVDVLVETLESTLLLR